MLIVIEATVVSPLYVELDRIAKESFIPKQLISISQWAFKEAVFLGFEKQ